MTCSNHRHSLLLTLMDTEDKDELSSSSSSSFSSSSLTVQHSQIVCNDEN